MRLSQEIKDVFASKEETIQFRTLLDKVSHKSYGVFFVILALPSALPLPAPGYSVPFALALIPLAIQVIRQNERPWFPEKLLNRELKSGSNKLVNGMVKFLAFFEYFVQPRLIFVYNTRLFVRILGCVILACGLSMCIPIPLTNTVPAMGIFLIGLGMLEDDGLFGLAGICAAIAGLSLTAAVLIGISYVGWEAIDIIKNAIKSVLGMA
jgi:hypothetical protein